MKFPRSRMTYLLELETIISFISEGVRFFDLVSVNSINAERKRWDVRRFASVLMCSSKM